MDAPATPLLERLDLDAREGYAGPGPACPNLGIQALQLSQGAGGTDMSWRRSPECHGAPDEGRVIQGPGLE